MHKQRRLLYVDCNLHRLQSKDCVRISLVATSLAASQQESIRRLKLPHLYSLTWDGRPLFRNDGIIVALHSTYSCHCGTLYSLLWIALRQSTQGSIHAMIQAEWRYPNMDNALEGCKCHARRTQMLNRCISSSCTSSTIDEPLSLSSQIEISPLDSIRLQHLHASC